MSRKRSRGRVGVRSQVGVAQGPSCACGCANRECSVGVGGGVWVEGCCGAVVAEAGAAGAGACGGIGGAGGGMGEGREDGDCGEGGLCGGGEEGTAGGVMVVGWVVMVWGLGFVEASTFDVRGIGDWESVSSYA